MQKKNEDNHPTDRTTIKNEDGNDDVVAVAVADASTPTDGDEVSTLNMQVIYKEGPQIRGLLAHSFSVFGDDDGGGVEKFRRSARISRTQSH